MASRSITQRMQRDHVRVQSPEHATAEIDAETLARVETCAAGGDAAISRRLSELDREWDIERWLETNGSLLAGTGIALAAARDRRWLLLSGAVVTFCLQHAIQGWCPPVELFRRVGVRTRAEIDAERNALKALRGDFGAVDGDARAALHAAMR